MADPLVPSLSGGGEDKVGDDFGVCGGREVMALLLKLLAQLSGIDDITIMSQGKFACWALDYDRLGVTGATGAGGGISVMSDGDLATELTQYSFIEGLGDQAHLGVSVNTLPIGGGDARALLATVLEGIETKEGEPGHILARGVDPKKGTAFLHASFCCPLNIYYIPLPEAGSILKYTKCSGGKPVQRAVHCLLLNAKPMPGPFYDHELLGLPCPLI